PAGMDLVRGGLPPLPRVRHRQALSGRTPGAGPRRAGHRARRSGRRRLRQPRPRRSPLPPGSARTSLMEILTGYGTVTVPRGPVAAPIGNCAGVHTGHRALIAEARAEAARRGLAAAVVTFDPHPLRVLAPERAPKMILPRRQKIEVLASLGVDIIVIIPFDREIAAVPAEEFVRRFLTGRLHVACLLVGEDFRFGRDRIGDIDLLRRLGPECGFEVRAARLETLGGARVSASQVREAIRTGDMARAAELMGRPYVLVGEVVTGHGRGRALKIPTA